MGIRRLHSRPFFAFVTAGLLMAASASAQISNTPYEPTAQEQYVLTLINQARQSSSGLDVLSRIVTNNLGSITASSGPTAGDGTAWSENFWTSTDSDLAFTMNYFQVNPGDLKAQFQALALPGKPLAWNRNLGAVAKGYNSLMIADHGASPEHNVPPYTSFDQQRYIDGGYTGAQGVGENAYRDYHGGALYTFAAFMVDWTLGGNGIQNPAGHRNTLTSPFLEEVGVSLQDSYTPGNTSAISEYGVRENFAAVTGTAYIDANSNNAYDEGEGLGDVVLSATNILGGDPITTETWAAGGYTLQLAAGTYNLTATGSFGTIALGSAVIGDDNVLIDVIQPVPEPASLSLLTLCAAGLLRRRRRQ